MHVTIKSPEEQEKMRVAGRLAAEVLDMIEEHVVPGVTTDELDKLCHDYIVEVQKSIPANLNYRGFPKTICTSVNHVVCHGIPNEKRLKAGDFVNIDVTVIRDGFHGDTSRMYFVGKPAPHTERLAKTCNSSRSATTPWCVNTAGTESVACTTRIRRCCITASPARAWSSVRA
jgi:methionyl aminopeptidase